MYHWLFSNNKTTSDEIQVAKGVLDQISARLESPTITEDKKKKLEIVKKTIKYYFSL